MNVHTSTHHITMQRLLGLCVMTTALTDERSQLMPLLLPLKLLTCCTIIFLITACGQNDSQGSSVVSAKGVIAELLRTPPKPGVSVEFDTYAWHGWAIGEASSSIEYDAQGCPKLTSTTNILVDQPTPWVIPLLSIRTSNFTNELPPDSAAWLMVSNVTNVPYHARVRGHFGDPETAHCPTARHLFTVDKVVETYVETPPELAQGFQRPADYAAWQEYHDSALGYHLRYPPGWSAEPIEQPGVAAALALRSPQHPDFPILVRVHDGETHYDQYDLVHKPPLLKQGHLVFSQDQLPLFSQDEQHKLSGYYAYTEAPSKDSRNIAVVFSNYGRSYELFLRYPLGLNASLDLTSAYTFVVLSFDFDSPPGPTPTPPVQQALGKGPFLSVAQILTQLQRKYGADAKLLGSQLVSEADARRSSGNCSNFEGHYDGIWQITIYGTLEGMWGVNHLVLNATTGDELCSVFEPDLSRPTATPFVPTETPRPEPSPYPAPLGSP